MQKFTTLAAAAALFVTGTHAIATRGAPPTTQELFAMVDTDHSGFVEPNEARDWLKGHGAPDEHIDGLLKDLWGADTNQDGVISYEEWMAREAKPRSAPAGYTRRRNTIDNRARDDASPRTANGAAAFNTLGATARKPSVYLIVDCSFDEVLCPTDVSENDDCMRKAFLNHETQEYEVCITNKATDEVQCFEIDIVMGPEEKEEQEKEEEEAEEEEKEEEEQEEEEEEEEESSGSSGDSEEGDEHEEGGDNEEGEEKKAEAEAPVDKASP